MNHLIFYTSTNQKGRHDATGAFIPEAKKLRDYLLSSFDGDPCVDMVGIKTTGYTAVQRREQVEEALKGYGYDCVYFLCHGYKNGIQFGYKWKWGANRLVGKILQRSPDARAITFYCCSVAKDKNNFCEWVHGEMEAHPIWWGDSQVFGHYTAGHATMNPKIKIYSTGYKPFIWSKNGVTGYNELMQSGKADATKRMRDPDDTLRFSIPFLPMVFKKHGFTFGWKK